MAAFLIGYFGVRPWYRDRQVNTAAEALIADLDAHAGQVGREAEALPALPDNPTKAELRAQVERISARLGESKERTMELRRRAEEILPKAREEAR